MVFFAQPIPVYRPPPGKADPEVLKLWNEMNTVPTDQERQKVFGEMQKYTLDQVYAMPFGSLTKVQAVRAERSGVRAVPHPAHVERLVREMMQPSR